MSHRSPGSRNESLSQDRGETREATDGWAGAYPLLEGSTCQLPVVPRNTAGSVARPSIDSFYSLRSIVIGFTLAARRAGMRHAAVARRPMKRATPVVDTTSGGPTEIGRLSNSGA